MLNTMLDVQFYQYDDFGRPQSKLFFPDLAIYTNITPTASVLYVYDALGR